MADKSTRLMTDALSRAVAEPDGLPLFAAKAVPGLFPPTAAARVAAQRCKDDGLLSTVADRPREVCAITDKGRAWLLNQSSPRQVLEDFVRVLEDRQQQADELTAAARRMSASIDSLKSAVDRLRPLADKQTHHLTAEDRPDAARRFTLDAELVSRLEQWHTAALGDCPLPELYRRVRESCPDLSIGRFHDGLRELHARGLVYLQPWTGPLYDLPEPPFALMTGHEIAYYASART